jgi:predicted ATPase/DNA-binding SARP family transcriptional activator
VRGPEPAAIEFLLLGPVQAIRDASTLRLGGPRQRALLALLLVERGRPVAAARLAEELWHGRPPPAASATLPTYVSRLRAALGADAPIDSSTAGYRLDVEVDQVDILRFERLAHEGREALARGAAQRAAERLGAALALWRGEPFGDLADEGALRGEAERLQEMRLQAIEDRVEAELSLGESAELLDDLEGLVRAHPYRERFWRQLILALYRAQRQADALAAYQRARTVLDEELGLEPGEELKRLEQAILRQDVPVVQRPEERHNLPAAVTSFVGREVELAEIGRLLGEVRLLTLTGVGGVGKTRLALEAASRALPDFPDGVVFVDLSSLVDGGHVPRAVALALELGEGSGADVASLVEEVRRAELLLVLDNCEHVRDSCAELAHSLLISGPRLRLIATSRELLGAPGEVDYPVSPLSLPSAAADRGEVRESEAVRLFLERAQAVRPRLLADDEATASAARICADLDGLPLAIELAAARAKALSLDDIASRLSDRFRFLVSWRRLAAARHRTLREAMDWSYELLDAAEQALLARLSVFAGDFTLADAAQVCMDGDEERTPELLERLVTASLVVAEERDREMRYRLLETVRQYAEERLDPEATERTRRAHAQHFLAVAKAADLSAVPRRGRQRLDLAIAAQDNLRGALAWSLASESIAFGLELATSLERFWVTNDPREGTRWFAALLEPPTPTRSSRACGRTRFAPTEDPRTSQGWTGLPTGAGSRASSFSKRWATSMARLFSSTGWRSAPCAAASSCGRASVPRPATGSTSRRGIAGARHRRWGRSARSPETQVTRTALSS